MFALVESKMEQGKALCFLRYVKENSGWKKYNTETANTFLQRYFPDYLHYSPLLDAHLHGVPTDKISFHHQPKKRLALLLEQGGNDVVEHDLFQLLQLLQQQGLDLTQFGVTGSILVGTHHQQSDIDLICYGYELFHACRNATRHLIEQGFLQELNHEDWQASYQRRLASLTFDEYVWHERRKFNKAIINNRKFDLNLIETSTANQERVTQQKMGKITVCVRVIDDKKAFHYPAEWLIDHEEIQAVVCFTATYTGQAVNGEWIEVAGLLEQTSLGQKRLVVGSNREAPGEYIKVVSRA